MSGELTFTGERFLPGTRGEIWVEHWHRYHFARRWAAGRRVLDVACGEGYGTALLAREAAHVTGVDVAEAAIAHARAAYGGLANAEFLQGSCERLPLGDASVDLAVSFETLEHIEAQEAFVGELARVLRPGGVLLLSCPNRLEYSDKRGFANEFHVRELYRDELARLVAARFPAIDWYGQRPTFYSVIAPELGPGARAAGELLEVAEPRPEEGTPHLASPLYFVLAAARGREALAAVPPAVSVLADRDEWVRHDYEKVMRWMEESVARANRLEEAVRLQEAAIGAQAALADAREVAHRAELAARDAAPGWRGWRHWLRQPFVRLGLVKPGPADGPR